MTDYTVSRRETLQALGIAGVSLAGVSSADATDSGTLQTGEVTITTNPSDMSLTQGNTTTFDIVVLDAMNGISSYKFIIEVEPSIVEFTDFTEIKGGSTSHTEITNSGERLSLDTALLGDKFEGAAEIVIATATIQGISTGTSDVTISGNPDGSTDIADNDVNAYNTTFDSGTATVSEGTGPVASFSWSPSNPEAGTDVTFDASNSSGDNLEYNWDFTGDGSIDQSTTDPTTIYSFPGPGDYTVSLEVIDGNGNSDESTQQVSVAESSPPVEADFSWSPTNPEAGTDVTFDASTSSGDNLEYRWDFTGDGTTDATTTNSTTTHAYSEAGDYDVTLEVVDDSGESDQSTQQISVAEPPETTSASFTWSPDSPAPGEQVSFDASSSTGTISEYRWDFTDDGQVEQTTTQSSVSHQFDTDGYYDVVLEVVDESGNTATERNRITVGDPTVDLSASFVQAPSPGIVDQEVTFDASASTGDIAEYRWDFTQDGTIDETTSDAISHYTYGVAGNFEVTLVVESTDGSTDETSRVIPIERPDETLSAAFDWTPQNPAPDEEVTFDASNSTGDIQFYNWDVSGDGTDDITTASQTITNTYDVIGEYVVTLTIEDSTGSEASTSSAITVGDPANAVEASIEASETTINAGREITLDASGSTGNITAYQWDFDGDGESDLTTSSPTTDYRFETVGTFDVSVTLAGDGPPDTDTVTITVTEPPSAPEITLDFSPSEPEPGETVSIEAVHDGEVVEYQWELGDGTEETTSSPSITHTYDSGGLYVVRVSGVDPLDRTTTASAQLTVQEPGPAPSPTFSVSTDSPVTGEEITFDAGDSTGDIVEYRWDFDGDGTADDTTTNGTVTTMFQNASTTNVTLTVVDGTGRQGTFNRTIDISEPGTGSDDNSTPGSDDGTPTDSDGGGDALGPVVGGAGALGVLGGAAYVIKRRLTRDDEE